MARAMSEEERKGAIAALTELKRALLTSPYEGSISRTELLNILDDLRDTYKARPERMTGK